MDPGVLLSKLFDKKKLALIKLFLNNPENEYYLREAAKQARQSPATTLRIFDLFEKNNLLTVTKIKKMKLYRLADSKEARFFKELLSPRKSATEEFVELVKEVSGVDKVIQHGLEEKDKLNVLIIGSEVDNVEISKIVGFIKEKYNFSILNLTLLPNQYEQMSSMGLYSGEKKVLWSR